MSNYELAIVWAEQTTKIAEQVFSDQFFVPFTKAERVRLTADLKQRGITVKLVPGRPKGAILTQE